jgi:hypothetical protein
LVFILCGLALWVTALPLIDLRAMNDLGLISVFPPRMFLALGALTLGFFSALYSPWFSRWVAGAAVISLIVVLYGTPAIVEGVPRTEAAMRHIGYIEFITRSGGVDPLLNAYFNWPGFFALGAVLTEAMGLPNAIPLALWTPLALDLLYAGPLLLVFRSVTRDERLAWLGLWIFFQTNWVGQDYFSPQGFGFLLHLTILAILLRWFSDPAVDWASELRRRAPAGPLTDRIAGLLSWASASEVASAPSTTGQRVALVFVLLVLYATLISSHQLTPFVAFASVSALVVLGRCQLRWLPVLVGVMIGAWAGFFAFAFMRPNIEALLGEVGKVNSIMSSNLTERLQGSDQHLFINHIRLVLTLGVWGMAGLGFLRRTKEGRSDLTLLALAFVPFTMLALQAYGGEMAFRVYLFTLPAMAFLATRLFFPTTIAAASYLTRLSAFFVSIVIMLIFLFARYGNERMDYFTHEELAGMQEFHAYIQSQAAADDSSASDLAPLLIMPSWDLPLRFQRDEQFSYAYMGDKDFLDDEEAIREGTSGMDELMQRRPHSSAYFLSTRSSRAHLELTIGLPGHVVDEFEERLLSSGRARVIIENRDARVLLIDGEETD